MAASTDITVKVRVTGQGEAEVLVDGKKLGFVCHSASARGWWAYDRDGNRVGEFKNHSREAAVTELVKSFYPHAQ